MLNFDHKRAYGAIFQNGVGGADLQVPIGLMNIKMSYDLRKHQKEFSTVGEMKTYFVILRSAKYGILW